MPPAITDLKILEGEGAVADDGWEMIPVDLNEGAGGKWLWLAYTRDPNQQANAVTQIKVVTSSASEEGWQVLGNNLNEGTRKHGTDLWLAFQRGGQDRPIIALQVITKKNDMIDGYTFVDRDLNESAGGADLFVTFLRNTRSLTIKNIKCMSPSTGVGSVAKSAVTATAAALTTAGATAAGVAVGAATGPFAVAVVVGSATGGAALGVAIADGINAATGWAGKKISDDVYIKVNDKKVWPTDHKSVGMHKGDKRDVNVTIPLTKDIEIAIMERDPISADDDLGEGTFSSHESDGYHTYLYGNTDEDDVYSVEIEVG